MSPILAKTHHSWALRVAASALASLTIGCAPAIKFLQTEAKPNVEDGKIKSVTFLAAFQADNLTDQQVVYKVRILNRRNEPLRSANGAYRDSEGDVAASKTYMIGPSPFVVPDAQVSIPARELEVRRGDLPISAEFFVFDAAGKELAKTTGPIPVRSAGPRTASRETESPDNARSSREQPPQEKNRGPFNPWTARRSYSGEPPPPGLGQPGGPADPDIPQPRSAAGTRESAAAAKRSAAPSGDPHAD